MFLNVLVERIVDVTSHSRMSKRKRRNSRRRKSSSSSKQCISPYNFQKHTMVDTEVHGEEAAEKGETDSFCKEIILSESEDEKENETTTTEKENRPESCEDFFEEKEKKDLEPVDRDPGLTITHSVTFDNFGLTSPRVVFKQCHEASLRGSVSSVIAVTTTKVKGGTPNMRLEISEVVTSDDSNIKRTIVLHKHKDKIEETHFTSHSEKHQDSKNPTVYSWNQHGADYRENVIYKISIAELNAEETHASTSHCLWDEPEEGECRKSCCKNNFGWGNAGDRTDTDFTLVDGSSCCSSPSDMWQCQKRLPLPTSLSNDALWDIPPPDEFADNVSAMDFLAENVASCQISPKQQLIDHDNTNFTDTASQVILCKECKCQNTLDVDNRCCEHLSDLSPQECLFMNPRASMNRSSFTKKFIDSHERKTRLRNNSIAILETQTDPTGYMDIPPKRRKTYPGVAYHMSQARESIPSYRESFSSGTLSSFFMQSLPSQSERRGKFYLEDERLRPHGSRKSSSSSSYRPSSSSTTCPDSFNPKCKAYSTIKNPFYPFRSDESPEEVFFRGEQYNGTAQFEELIQPGLDGAAAGLMLVDKDSALAGQLELNEVNESGFEDEMVELDESISPGDTMDSHQRELLIHVIPPSLSNSEEKINEGTPNGVNHIMCYRDEADAPRKRRGSVMTIITGDCEQRFLHGKYGFFLEKDISGEYSKDTLSPVTESPAGSPIEDLGSIREAVEELQGSSQAQTTTTSANSELTLQMDTSSQQPEEVKTNEALEKISADACVTPNIYQNDLSRRQSASKNSLEVKEHLRPPTESTHKDSEEHSDHWAKRRKLFKESKQRSSAGGSSITSNITDESDTMNSEDTHSVDMSMRDIEDRGFYTETFHSVSWIYHGDGVNQNDGPHCLTSCTRPAAIRERTVKIGKGMGDYPWGFRIQFSKPIVVTEVDTNGAAEEAGLQVGDYVLAVNGIDVTSVPHSEAADLARQGPDILTLTIGSDIGRAPNTPRPTCRGYLHKRTQSSLLKGWRKRWFVLRHDCCLYYYRNKRDEGKSRALAAVSLEGAQVEADTSLGKPFVFRCCPVSGNRVYYLYATSNQEMKRWLEAMGRAVHPITQNHVWVDVTRHNSNLPPLAVKTPECLGLLHQLDRSKDSWVQHYCVLKDGCLYFYTSIRSTCAIGGIYLHGYTVRDQPLGSKRSTIELRPPSDEFKVFTLCAENANENKRWISAIKSSIGKWLPLHQAIQDYMSRPPEETRM
ncbi:pleckstriny domain-containing family A [Pimephales promelas]|nr:pleckstriny domain-containing family A [Pimephales promelas]